MGVAKVTFIKSVKSTSLWTMRLCGKNLNIVSMCAVSPVVHTSNISSCQKKKTFFGFHVAVNNSIKVGTLVFLLLMSVITENIMKRPVFNSCSLYVNEF